MVLPVHGGIFFAVPFLKLRLCRKADCYTSPPCSRSDCDIPPLSRPPHLLRLLGAADVPVYKAVRARLCVCVACNKLIAACQAALHMSGGTERRVTAHTRFYSAARRTWRNRCDDPRRPVLVSWGRCDRISENARRQRLAGGGRMAYSYDRWAGELSKVVVRAGWLCGRANTRFPDIVLGTVVTGLSDFAAQNA